MRAQYLCSGLALALSAVSAAQEQEPAETAVYAAALQPLNSGANRGRAASGAAVFVRQGDRLQAYVRGAGLAPEMVHRQMVHVGGECSREGADANADGVVDVLEGVPAFGLVLFPLDSNLADPAAGDYPRTDAQGVLSYRARGSFQELRNKVTGIDPNPDDPQVTLEEGQPLELEGMTVVLHGVQAEGLPGSVQGVAGVDPHLTVPVACGVIERLDGDGAEGQ